LPESPQPEIRAAKRLLVVVYQLNLVSQTIGWGATIADELCDYLIRAADARTARHDPQTSLFHFLKAGAWNPIIMVRIGWAVRDHSESYQGLK